MEYSKVMSFFGILLWIIFASDSKVSAKEFGLHNFRLHALLCSLGKRVIADNSHLALYCKNTRQSQSGDKDVACFCLRDDICTPRNCRPECKTNEECPNNRSCIVQKCRDPCLGFCGFAARCKVMFHLPHCTCPNGYAGDPQTRCYPRPTSQVSPRKDPCSSSPCGTNAWCHEGVCACIDRYHGDPHNTCYPDCVGHADCPDNRVCINNECLDPCPDAHCASSAMCEVIGHKAKCNCPSEMTGDPRVKCYKEIPTIIPRAHYDPVATARKLHSALEAVPPRIDDVIDVLTHSTRVQLVAFIDEYGNSPGGYFGANLQRKLIAIDPTFSPIAEKLYVDLTHFLARELSNARNDSRTVMQILTALNNTETQQVMSMHDSLKFDSDPPLSDYLVGRIDGKFAARIAKSQLSGERSEDPDVDDNAASEDARAILDEGKKNAWTTDNSKFHTILTTRSYPQLRRISEKYKVLSGQSLQDSIERQFMQKTDAAAYAAIVTYADSKVGFFASELAEAATTGDLDTVIRIVLWRAEIDLVNIKQKYEEISPDPSLAYFLKERTSGYQQKLLLAITGL